MDKKIRVWWDIAILEQYGKSKMTSRHLRWDLGPNYVLSDPELESEWYGFFNLSEQTLLDLIISRRKIKLQKLQNKNHRVKRGIITFQEHP